MLQAQLKKCEMEIASADTTSDEERLEQLKSMRMDLEQQKVDMFLMTNGEFLPEHKIPFVREKLLTLDESKWGTLSTIQFKNPTTALLLSIFLGGWGVDRIYIGNTGMGIGKLLTCGGFGIWTIIDWFSISGSTKEQNYNKLQSYLY